MTTSQTEQTAPQGFTDACDAVRVLLRFAGYDPDQPVIRDTPGRVARALADMTAGTRDDPRTYLDRVFPEQGADGLVVVSGIRFASLCEHHMLPFSGTATVGYIPRDGRLLGLSKLPRLVNVFARRLQLQERLTEQIARTIHEDLPAKGAACMVTATHTCVSVRGVTQPHSTTVTRAWAGCFRDDPEARLEFLGQAESSPDW
ncbi:GTP cyclohydrolase I [Kibdelosporangium banguiense]|uniref:GTP cyclohydrolase 1 n=1 Tax=Kibdelosporangium banguiense TaxID=1365924 RepID=A0ABS4TLR4_9PSEU|nr:GTP cyclohydrolase I [Kibdelosporangium banguiense]MBP2325345.1 GTP cyclohydrolase I [Kibdelosporangium banguiense]